MGHGQKRRIRFLDELRGLCVVLMVAYHALFVIGYLFNVSVAHVLFDFFTPVQPFFAGLFVVICGISCHLSHNNLKRGLLLAGFAAVLSAVMWCAVKWGILDQYSYIWFGVLHCLAACILLYTVFQPTLRLLPPWLGILINAVLLAFTWHVPYDNGGFFGIPGLFSLPVPQAPPNTPWLYPFGLCPVYGASDYFPLIPWFFAFLIGTYIGVWARNGKFPKALYKSRVPCLSTVGRHALWVYALHQPIIYLICLGISELIALLS
ncbi:MAG: DUF1624 domain-containing protein [Clostridia bacterium]|nr:DUF1624 domain-containing protein [Clostridia bacterium]